MKLRHSSVPDSGPAFDIRRVYRASGSGSQTHAVSTAPHARLHTLDLDFAFPPIESRHDEALITDDEALGHARAYRYPALGSLCCATFGPLPVDEEYLGRPLHPLPNLTRLTLTHPDLAKGAGTDARISAVCPQLQHLVLGACSATVDDDDADEDEDADSADEQKDGVASREPWNWSVFPRLASLEWRARTDGTQTPIPTPTPTPSIAIARAQLVLDGRVRRICATLPAHVLVTSA
jgi:hypothetical protein